MISLLNLKQWARRLKAETVALYLAARDPATPCYAKFLVAAVVAYALSPIDLIPDFIPILGYLDDFVLLPLGITLALRLIPPQVLAACRVRAQEISQNEKSVSKMAGEIIIMIWLLLAVLCGKWFYENL